MAKNGVVALELDFRSTYSSYDYPTEPEVTRYFQDNFRDDHSKMIKKVRGASVGAVYRIEAKDLTPYLNLIVKINGIETAIKPV